jgi:hypothetical protein
MAEKEGLILDGEILLLTVGILALVLDIADIYLRIRSWRRRKYPKFRWEF